MTVLLIVRRQNTFLAPLIALATIILAHIWCWLPIALTSLGLGGSAHFFHEAMPRFQWLLYIPLLAYLIYAGKKAFFSPKPNKAEKISFCVSLIIVGIMLFFWQH